MSFSTSKNCLNRRLEIRLTEAEFEQFRKFAEQHQMSVSEYVRACVHAKKIVAKSEAVALEKVLNELRRQGGFLKKALADLHDPKQKEVAVALANAYQQTRLMAKELLPKDRGG